MSATTAYRKGDQVELLRDFGPLKEGSKGFVVETVSGATYYPVSVVWPSLRRTDPPEAGGFEPEGIDLSNLHEGDVVPMTANEIRGTGKNFLNE